MKNPLLSISFSLLLFPAHYLESKDAPIPDKKIVVTHSINEQAEILYNELHLSDAGLSETGFAYAYTGYECLVKKGKINSDALLAICDLTQSSNKKRFYILDLSSNKILLTSYVAHGRGSGMEFATRFSNKANSHQSSLGFYITSNTYYGEHGLSLRLEGLEPGFNDHAIRRNIVIHGAKYIGDEYLDDNKFMGRSYGCPAVPQNESTEIINLIKNGNCLFIYHPTKIYLQRSHILNG